MPASKKSAPPQQASLKEMWGKKRDKSTASAPPPKEEPMDVDIKVGGSEGNTVVLLDALGTDTSS